jgi:DNA-binding CsgD family transcriptional regulator
MRRCPLPLPVPRLTPRERKILELVAQGLSNRDMAETLSISRLTVECHTKNIYRKLAVTSRTEAVFQGAGTACCADRRLLLSLLLSSCGRHGTGTTRHA